MSDRLATRLALLAKIESTYGTDSIPTGSANAIMTKGLRVEPLQGATESRDLDRASLGNEATYHVAPFDRLTFQVEFAGSSAVGTAPDWGVLLRACGFDETIDAGVSVTYAPISTGFESVTLYYYRDRQLRVLLGARGSVKFMLSPGGIPHFEFMFLGLRATPTEIAMPTVDWSRFIQPLPVTAGNSPTFTLDSYSANMVALDLDMAVEVVHSNVVSAESIKIVDRAPTGTIRIEEPLISAKNYHTIIENHGEIPLQFIHGSTAGNILTIDAPKVQLLSPVEGENQKVATLEATLNIIPDAGDDELVLTVT